MMSMHIRRGFTNLFYQKNSFFCELRSSLSVYLSTCTTNHLAHTNPDLLENLIRKYNFHPQMASQLASVFATLKNPKSPDTLLSFFIENGFSRAQLEQILKSRPQLLSLQLEKIVKPKIKIFRDFGFSSEEIVEFISKQPLILHASANKSLIPSLSVLKSLLGSTGEVAKLLKVSGWFLRADLNTSLVPNIDLLMSCGVDMERIVWLMHYMPRFLLLKPEYMKSSVEKADRLGADKSTKMYIHSVRIAGSLKSETLERKKKAFRDVGFSEDDILRAFRKAPPAFLVSEEKLKKVVELVLATGKYDISCILRSPTSLCRSIEKRFKPRIQVFRVLEDNKLITQWPAFWVVFDMPEKDFFAKYVGPYYNEVGELYMSMISPRVGKKEVNPVPSPL